MPSRRRARLGALLACLAVSSLLPGCAMFHRHQHADVGCKKPIFTGNADSLPPLKAPAGLNTPDTSQEIKVPPLNEPAPLRAHNAPCLDWPPQYVNEPLLPPVRRAPT